MPLTKAPTQFRSKAVLYVLAVVLMLSACNNSHNGTGTKTAKIAASSTSVPCPDVDADLAAAKASTTTRSSSAPGSRLVILAANRRNSVPITVLPSALCRAIADAAQDKQPIVLIRLDGRPVVLGTAMYPDTAANSLARAVALTKFVNAAAKSIVGVNAKVAHVDILAGLGVAGRQIRDAGGTGTIYVLGSGLQETGALNFSQQGLIDADAKDITAFVKGEHQLPDLTGARVEFVGVDVTASPQAALDNARSAKLRAIWSDIVGASQAVSAGFVPLPSAAAQLGLDVPALPPVNLVPLPVPPGPVWNPHQHYPNTGPLGFWPDKTVLLNEPAARDALKDVPAWLRTNPGCRLLITGTTARVGSFVGQQTLATGRAAAIKNLIDGLGAPAARILVQGLGSKFPGYVQDHDPRTGLLLPIQAQHNRSVYFTPLCGN